MRICEGDTINSSHVPSEHSTLESSAAIKFFVLKILQKSNIGLKSIGHIFFLMARPTHVCYKLLSGLQ